MPVESLVYGARVRLDPREFVDRWLIFAPQLYDYREISVLERYLRAGDVFIDVGAYIGVYSLAALRKVGDTGRVLAIEPDPLTFQRLQETAAANRLTNLLLVNVGVSDRHERLRLGVNVFGNRGGSSFVHHPDYPGVDVDCAPLLSILEEHGIRQVTAAKFDIEGFEHRVLSAFLSDAPRDMWPALLVLERAPEDARTGDVAALVTQHGYRECMRVGENRVYTRT